MLLLPCTGATGGLHGAESPAHWLRKCPSDWRRPLQRFDDILSELGATRVGERYKHDASSGVLPEGVAVEWCREWASKLQVP